MKSVLMCLFILVGVYTNAQQTIMFTQYTFNKAGMNPAASGTDIEREIYYSIGSNRQWAGLANGPKQSFFNLSYTIRPPRSYKRWQNVGIYYDLDNSGLLNNSGIYANYTVHYLIRKKIIASFGVYAGVRRYTRSVFGFDTNDPAVMKNKTSIFVYPDIIPGARITDKKYFVGIAVRQLTIYKLQDFKGRKIGSPSRLRPSIYFEFGRMITLSDNLLMMPSFAVNTPIVSLPIIDATVIFYYANRIGLGAGIRNTSFLSGMFQIRFLENMTAGFAYSYPINNVRFAARNSFEIMVGVVPMGMSAKLNGRHSIAKCPVLSY
jgi:type IX secretion system PorP/SprF family membrane protein